jgi:hypothetical protein
LIQPEGTKLQVMAKALLSALIDELVGKMGNAVFQRGKAGLTVRKRVIPFNPKSTAQTAARARITTFSKAWSGLTDAQRIAWDAAAGGGSWGLTDTLGNSFNPSGEQLYVGLNCSLSQIGESAITSPPSHATFSSLSLGTITAAAGTPTLTIAYGGTLGGSETFVVYATPQLSPGIMSPSESLFREIDSYNSASPVNALSAYTAKFGTLVAGQKVHIRLEVVNQNTGEKVVVGTGYDIIAA